MNYCATCGDRTYEPGGLAVSKCDGCDKAPFFCTCLARRREARRRRMEAARSRATAR